MTIDTLQSYDLFSSAPKKLLSEIELVQYQKMKSSTDLLISLNKQNAQIKTSRVGHLKKHTATFLQIAEKDISNQKLFDYLRHLFSLYEERPCLASPVDCAQRLLQGVYTKALKNVQNQKPPYTFESNPFDFFIKVQTEKELTTDQKRELRHWAGLSLRKKTEYLSEQELTSFIQKLEQDYARIQATDISALARFLSLHELQGYYPFADDLSPEDRAVVSNMCVEDFNLSPHSRFCSYCPQGEDKISYWIEALSLSHDAPLIFDLARKKKRSPWLSLFPHTQHSFLLTAADLLLHDSLKKMHYDPFIFSLFYEVGSSPAKMKPSLQRAIENTQIFCELAQECPKKDLSFLEMQTESIIQRFACDDDKIRDLSKEAIHNLLTSDSFEKDLRKLSRLIVSIRSSFAIEHFLICFHKLVYKVLNHINTNNIELKVTILGKEPRKVSAGEDDFFPLAVFLIHRMNDPEVYERLCLFDLLNENDFLSARVSLHFLRAVGANQGALEMLKQHFRKHPRVQHLREKSYRACAFASFSSFFPK